MDGAGGAPTAEFLTFRLDREEYAIDILQVREIRAHETITRIVGAPPHVRGVINLRGAIVPIFDLRVKLGFGGAGEAPVVIILVLSGGMVGMLVDGVTDVTRLAAGEVRPAPDLGTPIAARFIRGIAPLDGRMLVLVDIERLMSEDDFAYGEREPA